VRIVDGNALFGFWPRRRLEASLAAVVQTAAAWGVSSLAVCSIRGIFHDVARGNDETLAACRSDARLIPVATVNPLRLFGGEAEVVRTAAAGAHLFRFFPEYQGWDYRFRPFRVLLRAVRAAGGVAMVSARLGGHLEAGAVSQLLTALEETRARCILTGIYYGNLAESIDAARGYDGLFLETHLLNGPDSLEVAADEIGPDRLIYGSGAPLHYVAASMLPLRHCRLGDEAKVAVAGGNLTRLLEEPA
jgi:predicted TIM-barrel fold metal-dependent hydrolase